MLLLPPRCQVLSSERQEVSLARIKEHAKRIRACLDWLPTWDLQAFRNWEQPQWNLFWLWVLSQVRAASKWDQGWC